MTKKTEEKLNKNLDHKQNGLLFTYKNISFRLPNENVNSINTSSLQPFLKESYDLMQAMRKVKSQNLFGEINIAELAKKYSFNPFDYQIKNVETMLNRFNGKGVFGDQVGLGKTCEALITAHAMFETGAIRNALIVLPSSVEAGWEKEIHKKFDGIFSIYSNQTLEQTILDIEQDNQRPLQQKGFRLYFITDKQIKRALFSLNIANIDADTEELVLQAASSNEANHGIRENYLKEIKQKLAEALSDSLHSSKYNPHEILDPFDDCALTNEERTALIKFVEEEIIEKYNCIENRPSRELNKSKINKLIGESENAENPGWLYSLKYQQEITTKYALENNTLKKLFYGGDKRLIDLLIVDEIHTFYTNSSNTTKKGAYYQEDDFEQAELRKTQSETVKILANISKKFCILLSATPIRYSLDDVFDLLYIADKNRVGGNLKNGRSYFFNTICQLSDENTEHALSEMIFDEQRKENFFGFVNNFFTRQNACDVEEDMQGVDKGLLSRNETMPRDTILETCILYHCQKGRKEKSEQEARKDFDAWKKNTFMDENRKRHFFTAIDSSLIEAVIDNKNCTLEEKQNAHCLVDWRRRKKKGFAVLLKENESSSDTFAQKIAKNTASLESRLQELQENLNLESPSDSLLLNDFVFLSNVQENSSLAKICQTDAYEHISTEIKDLRTSLLYDTVLCYVSHVNARNFVREYLQQQEGFQDRVIITQDHKKIEEKVSLKDYNRIAIVDKGLQAGVNLQQYHTFVFAQMDIAGTRLLEPVDIEQWLGRIYRTGQTKNCRIVSILKTYMCGQNKNPDPSFLKWYYEILNDADGLNLYGDNTPDVAFMQPVIVDYLRQFFQKFFHNELSVENNIKKLLHLPPDSRRKDIQRYGFAELLELCYVCAQENVKVDMKEFVREKIREVAKMDGFKNTKR